MAPVVVIAEHPGTVVKLSLRCILRLCHRCLNGIHLLKLQAKIANQLLIDDVLLAQCAQFRSYDWGRNCLYCVPDGVAFQGYELLGVCQLVFQVADFLLEL